MGELGSGASSFAVPLLCAASQEVASIAAMPAERHPGSRPFARDAVPEAVCRNGRAQESGDRPASIRAAILPRLQPRWRAEVNSGGRYFFFSFVQVSRSVIVRLKRSLFGRESGSIAK